MKTLPAIGLVMMGLILGLVLGKASEKRPPQAEGELPQRPRYTKRPTSRDLALGASSSRLNSIRTASPSKLPGLTYLALQTGDPIEFQLYIAECLRNMTRENWYEVVASFGQVSSDTGRDPNTEWKLALFRSGQIAGEDAMNHYAEDGLENHGQQSWPTMYGWASADPRRALTWLQELEKSGSTPSKSLYNALLAGAALGNPQVAFDLLKQLPHEKTDDCAGHLVWNLTQNGGTQQLNELLALTSELDPDDPADATLRGRIQNEVSGKLFWQSGHSGNVEETSNAVTKLVDTGMEPNPVASSALNSFRYKPVSKQLDLIEATAKNLPSNANLDIPMLISRLKGANRAVGVEQWKQEHPDSPLIPFLSATE